MTEERQSLSPFDIWHISSKPILLHPVLSALLVSPSPRVAACWMGAARDTWESFTRYAGKNDVRGMESPAGPGSVTVCSSARERICNQPMLAAPNPPQFLCALGGNPSLSRIAHELRFGPGSGFNCIFEKRFSFPNECILFLRLFVSERFHLLQVLNVLPCFREEKKNHTWQSKYFHQTFWGGLLPILSPLHTR